MAGGDFTAGTGVAPDGGRAAVTGGGATSLTVGLTAGAPVGAAVGGGVQATSSAKMGIAPHHSARFNRRRNFCIVSFRRHRV